MQKVAVGAAAIARTGAPLGLPYDRTNDNYVGLTHAGALFTLGQSCAGVAVGAAFGLECVRLLARRAHIEYRRPGTSEVTPTAALAAEEIGAVERALAAEGTAHVPVAVTMVNAGGEAVAEMTVDYHLQGIA